MADMKREPDDLSMQTNCLDLGASLDYFTEYIFNE